MLLAPLFATAVFTPVLANSSTAHADVAVVFAPPLGTPLVLKRTLRREVRGGWVIKKTRQTIRFEENTRREGYILHADMQSVETDGPEEIAGLLAIGERLLIGETLLFDIDEQGNVTGAHDIAGHMERKLAALDGLIAEAQSRDAPEALKSRQIAVFRKMQAMPPTAQAQYLMSQVRPLFVLPPGPLPPPGSPLSNGAESIDRIEYAEGLVHLTAHANTAPGSDMQLETRIDIAVDITTGLTREYTRRITTTAGDTTRESIEELQLLPATE